MQFAPSSFSSDANLAALLMGGVAPAGTAVCQLPVAGGPAAPATAFADVFASLAPAPASAGISVPSASPASVPVGTPPPASVLAAAPSVVGFVPSQGAAPAISEASDEGATPPSVGQPKAEAAPEVVENDTSETTSEEPAINSAFRSERRATETRGNVRKGVDPKDKAANDDEVGEAAPRTQREIMPLDLLVPFVEAPVPLAPRHTLDASPTASQGDEQDEEVVSTEDDETRGDTNFSAATLPAGFNGLSQSPVFSKARQQAKQSDHPTLVAAFAQPAPADIEDGGDLEQAITAPRVTSTTASDFAATEQPRAFGNPVSSDMPQEFPVRTSRAFLASSYAPSAATTVEVANLSESAAQPVAPAAQIGVPPLAAAAAQTRHDSAGVSLPPAAPQQAAAQLEVAARENATVLNGSDLPRAEFAVRRTSTAKIAAATNEASSATDSRISARVKTFLNADGKHVARDESFLGTSVAKSEAIMPVTSFPDHATAAGTLPDESFAIAGSEGLSAALRDAEFTGDIATTHIPETAQAARRAVEAVLTTIDRVASREQPTVKLEFTVGDEQLAVRVELQGSEVRATFTTDSHELRSALAHEWQAMASGAERSVRVAPVFESSAGGQNNSQNFAGDTSSHSQHRHGGARSGESTPSFSSFGPSAESERSAPAPTAAPRTVSSTARHLHTLA